MESNGGRITRFKRDEYTGTNRCLPCTVVNLCIAFLLAVGVQVAAILQGVPELALPGSTALFLVSIAAIYFRGYLVPGTPTLTKRYGPDWLLVAFGKDQDATGFTGKKANENGVGGVDGDEHAIDVETALLDAGALTEQDGNADLRLTTEFERAFEERIGTLQTDESTRETLLNVLEVPPGDVTFEEFGDAFRVHRDGQALGTWESRPAFLADVAGAQLLAERVEGWEATSVGERGQLLNGLRLFLTHCPGCGGPLSFATDTVESCCSTHDVAAVTCDDCEARVFESNTAPA